MESNLSATSRLARLDHKLAKEAHKLLDQVLDAVYKQRHGHGHGVSPKLYAKIEAFVDDHCFD